MRASPTPFWALGLDRMVRNLQMTPFSEPRATTQFFQLRGAAERLGCSPIGSLVRGPVVANLPQTCFTGTTQDCFRLGGIRAEQRNNWQIHIGTWTGRHTRCPVPERLGDRRWDRVFFAGASLNGPTQPTPGLNAPLSHFGFSKGPPLLRGVIE